MLDKSKMKCVSIQAKVNGKTAARLDTCAERGGFSSKYELMQYLCSAFLKVADPDNEESPLDKDSAAYKELSMMFDGWMDRQSRIITTKPSCGGNNMKLVEQIYIYSEVGKRGHVVRMVKPSEERTYINMSHDHALSEVVRTLHPHLFDKLKRIGQNMGEKNVRRIIAALIDEIPAEWLGRGETTIQDEFEANMSNTQYGIVPKQTRKRRTIEDL